MPLSDLLFKIQFREQIGAAKKCGSGHYKIINSVKTISSARCLMLFMHCTQSI